MRPITSDSPVSTGDVLYNPALGFAQVVQVDPIGLHLAWHQDGDRLPRRVSVEAARKAYRVCRRDGFFSQAIRDSPGLRELMTRDPGTGLLLLLEELEEPQEPAAIGQWLERVDQGPQDGVTSLIQRIRPEQDARFVLIGDRLTLRSEPLIEDPDVTTPLPVLDMGPTPWAHLPPLTGLDVLHTGMELLGLLASSHATGQGVGLGPNSVTAQDDGRLEIAATHGSPHADMPALGRLLIRRILDRDLPRGSAPHRLLPFLAALADPLPPSVLPLLEDLLTPSAAMRPRSALLPYAQWSAAAAIEEVRAHAPLGGNVRLETGADTHIGRYKMRSHQTNQDAWIIEDGGDAVLLAVCDGISTSDAGTGDQASRIAVETLEQLWERRPDDLSHEGVCQGFLMDALTEANRAICAAASDAAGGDLRGRIPMGTTLVLALVHGQTADLVALGDSRIYLVGTSGAAVLTPDQNVEMEWHQRRRDRSRDNELMAQALVGYLGHHDESRGPVLLRPWTRRVRLLDGETLVLISDGITDYAAPTHLEFLKLVASVVRDSPCEDAAAALVAAANRGGGGDNATAVVARLSVR
jgi:protein phosphatase